MSEPDEQTPGPAHDHGAFDPCPESCPAREQTARHEERQRPAGDTSPA
jgi:hypothetical protein